MSKHTIAGKKKHLALTITQQLEILENGESQSVVMDSYSTGLYLWFRETERPIITVYGIKWKCEGTFKVTDTAEPQLVEWDRCLCKWFIAMHFDGKPITRPMIIEKAKCF